MVTATKMKSTGSVPFITVPDFNTWLFLVTTFFSASSIWGRSLFSGMLRTANILPMSLLASHVYTPTSDWNETKHQILVMLDIRDVSQFLSVRQVQSCLKHWTFLDLSLTTFPVFMSPVLAWRWWPRVCPPPWSPPAWAWAARRHSAATLSLPGGTPAQRENNGQFCPRI